MRANNGMGVFAALCLGFFLGALTLFAVTLSNRSEWDNALSVSRWVTVPDAPAVAERIEFLVRPEAPTKGVSVVSSVHQRAPLTDAEASQWHSAEELVTVEPGTAVKRIPGDAPGFGVTVEVINGPHEGLRGWVWQDTLRKEWP